MKNYPNSYGNVEELSVFDFNSLIQYSFPSQIVQTYIIL